MRPARSSFFECFSWAAVTAIGYFLLAAFAIHVSKGEGNAAAFWPPSGYFLALLMLMPARARLASFAAVAASSLAANMVNGTPFLLSAMFTAANGVEAIVALRLLCRDDGKQISFMAPGSVIRFGAAAALASFAGAVSVTMMTDATLGFFLTWMTAVALGMMIVAPPIITLARLVRTQALDNIRWRKKLESFAMVLLIAAATGVIFSQSHYPAMFLPVVTVIVASYRLGPFGAASGVLVVALITSIATAQGSGPIAAIDGSAGERVLFLQFYLLMILLTVMPLAALLVTQQRLARRLEESNRWLLQAEAAALVGHWHVDLLRWKITWSDQTYRIHGLVPGTKVNVGYSIEQYLPEDQREVRRIIEEAVETGKPFQYQGRIALPDGQLRYVQSHGSIERNHTGRAIGIFGTVQDVTAMVENAQNLEAARRRAETAANTDALTGLPNRRHTLACLSKALGEARENGEPLAVAIFDIDHFKRINDGHGHAVGDQVIRHVAKRAEAAMEKGDMVGRFGGEEFVCVFRGASALRAEALAEHLRGQIEAEVSDPEGLLRVTVSIGLAVRVSETSIEELLHRADEALYRAKGDGRNLLRLAA